MTSIPSRGAKRGSEEPINWCAGMSTQEASGDMPAPLVAGRLRRGAQRLELVVDLHVDRDLDLGADRDAAGFERLVPVQAEVVAVERTAEVKPRALVPPRILAAPLEVRVQLDLARRAADREVADDL